MRKLPSYYLSQKLSEKCVKNRIFGEEGVSGFFKGLSVGRAIRSILTLEVTSYDIIKEENGSSFRSAPEKTAFATLLHHFYA